jgi:integrase
MQSTAGQPGGGHRREGAQDPAVAVDRPLGWAAGTRLADGQPRSWWTAAQRGAYLDSIEEDRLYPLYHLAVYWGLRRGELAGLEWADVDLKTRRLHVRQAQAEDELDDTKTEDSDRIIVIDQETAAVLEAWQERQLFERLEWGDGWHDSGRVFIRQDGRPLRPGHISEHFAVLIGKAGRPPVRFHDLSHGAATMLIAAGQPVKVVSAILGTRRPASRWRLPSPRSFPAKRRGPRVPAMCQKSPP